MGSGGVMWGQVSMSCGPSNHSSQFSSNRFILEQKHMTHWAHFLYVTCLNGYRINPLNPQAGWELKTGADGRIYFVDHRKCFLLT